MRVSVFRNSVIHQNLSQFLQPLRDFGTQRRWLSSKQRISPFYRGFLFILGLDFWLAGERYQDWQQTTGLPVLSSLQHLGLIIRVSPYLLVILFFFGFGVLVAISVEDVMVGEVEELEEDLR